MIIIIIIIILITPLFSMHEEFTRLAETRLAQSGFNSFEKAKLP